MLYRILHQRLKRERWCQNIAGSRIDDLFYFQTATKPERLDIQISTDDCQLFLQRNQHLFVLIETGAKETA